MTEILKPPLAADAEAKIVAVTSDIAKMSRDPKWNRHVLIDCGFNTCRVLERFMANLPPTFRVYGFEILEELVPLARQFERDHGSQVASLEFAAVSDTDSTIPFLEVTKWGPNFKGGASTMERYLSDRRGDLQPKQIRAIDFSGWLSRKFDERDLVVIKMDIEGAEYAVLEKMVRDGTLAKVAVLIVEFHWMYFDADEREQYRARHDRLMQAIEGQTQIVEWF